jgi:hypothetical protein
VAIVFSDIRTNRFSRSKTSMAVDGKKKKRIVDDIIIVA